VQKVGFIGLGLMGNPMAKNILKKGFPLTVYNRTPEKTKELVSLGASVANSPKELAAQVDILITMITSGKDVEEVLFGNNGMVEAAKQDLIVIDMSTIGPTKAREIGAKLKEHTIAFLDAPVTGSTPKAISGELTIFVGGEKETLEKAHDVLSAMGTNIVHLGPMGSGQAIKLINNYIIASNLIALSDGMLLADALDLSREKAAEALLQTPNLSPTLQMKLSNYVKDNYPLAFTIANMRKDVTLALEEMKRANITLPDLVEVQKLYDAAYQDASLAQEDLSIIIKQIEKEIKK
jgi:3-hydroxyisobutyrate dehydrogenase